MFEPGDEARAAGTAGGKRSGQARQRLTLERVEAELGPLQTVEDAQRRLDKLNVWIAAGLLPGSRGGAAVRAIEVWLRGHGDRLDRERLELVEQRLTDFETQLGKGNTWRG